MSELLRVIEEATRLRSAGEPYVLGTIVRIEGPAYRRPGARMIVRRDGSSFGLISGGCLEGEVALQAMEVLETGAPKRIVLDVTDTSGAEGFGVGCGGRIHVLLNPFAPESEDDPSEALYEALVHRREIVLATVIDDDSGLLGQSSIFPDLAGLPDPRPVAEQARALLDHRRSRMAWATTGSTEIFLERIQPVTRLVVVGDGPDVAPIVTIARLLGWDVTVVGWKPKPDLAWRFPHAQDHVFLMHTGEIKEYVAIDPWTPVLLMTHHFSRDGELLRTLAESESPYIGLIGSRQRSKELLASIDAPAGLLSRLYTPAGLDIGSETPEEIALSILAEVQAVLNGRTGGILKANQAPIHDSTELPEPHPTA